jgi:hypothetical protein
MSDDGATRKIKEMQDALNRLGDWLAERDLIGEDNPGTVIPPPEQFALVLPAWGVAADHPDGQRLYGYGDSEDAFMVTRLREDGEWEHSMLDEYGMPIEWRLAIRPWFN